jgi:hypothetical protein
LINKKIIRQGEVAQKTGYELFRWLSQSFELIKELKFLRKENYFAVKVDESAHSHVAKGYNFNNLYFQNRSFEDVVRSIYQADKYGMGFGSNWPIEKKTEILPPFQGCGQFWWYWLAEENYTSECIYNAIKANKIFYDGINFTMAERIWEWNKNNNDYEYHRNFLIEKKIVDIHCCQVRPYNLQANALERIIDLSGILK